VLYTLVRSIFFGLILSVALIWGLTAFGWSGVLLPLALIAGHICGKPLGYWVAHKGQELQEKK
jgi:putative solute:sodium symporter small subunit